MKLWTCSLIKGHKDHYPGDLIILLGVLNDDDDSRTIIESAITGQESTLID